MAGLTTAFGSGAMSNSIAEIEDARVLMVMGSNTTEAHPIIAIRMKKAVRKGAKLIVVDPRRIDLVDHAHLWLPLRPGTDIALNNAMMHVIIKEGLQDKKFIKEETEGFEKYAKSLEKYTPELAEEITGVPADKIIEAARLYAGEEKAGIYYTLGVTEHTHGTNGVLSVANLALLTGNIGRLSSGVNPLRGQNNVQGACDMGCSPNVFPGYQSVTDPEARAKFEDWWGRPMSAKIGLTTTDMIDSMMTGELKAVYIMGENSVLSHAHMSHTIKALKKLDFLVVQDIFLTETAELADVVLPAASFAEKEGTFTNSERRVQRVRKAIPPPGEALDDLEIIGRLSRRMGYDHIKDSIRALGYHVPAKTPTHKNPEEVFKEICSLAPIMAGMTYFRLDEKGLQWPCPDANHPGTKFLFENGFPRGKGKFTPVGYEGSEELPDKKYPFLLTTGRMLFQYHTGTMTRKTEAIEEVAGQAYVEINRLDAETLGVQNNEMVTVASRRGKIELSAKVGDIVPHGVVSIPFHYVEAPANALTNSALDPICRIPELKVCAVSITKVD